MRQTNTFQHPLFIAHAVIVLLQRRAEIANSDEINDTASDASDSKYSSSSPYKPNGATSGVAAPFRSRIPLSLCYRLLAWVFAFTAVTVVLNYAPFRALINGAWNSQDVKIGPSHYAGASVGILELLIFGTGSGAWKNRYPFTC